jgi:glycosyltransferase involved in cell wall biosynthesis
MSKLLYISMMRLPTEKAHGLQIVQNCEAFADAGYDVTLWVARRINTPEMRTITDPYAYYGVRPNFKIRRVPCLDLFPLFAPDSKGARLAFYVQMLSYIVAMTVALLFTSADIYYSRDETLLAVLSRFKARAKIAYEAHLFSPTQRGASLQRQVMSRVGSVIAITPKLRADLIAQRGADPDRVIVAHDGIRKSRFVDAPDGLTARRAIGWHDDAFIVGFVGRLQMIGMDKGMGTLVEALAQVDGAHLALVGGPDDMAEQYRQMWLELGKPEAQFLYVGHVPPHAVPQYLRAFDVCAMPHPHTTQFAYYTSPLKLFEYMASHSAVVASDLPAWADVVTDGETALLVPPSDVGALTDAIQKLKDDPALRQRLADNAYQSVMADYTWSARAEAILQHIQSA